MYRNCGAVLLEIKYMFGIRHQSNSLYGLAPGWHLQTAICRPIKNLKEHSSVFAGCTTKWKLCLKWTGCTSINRLSIYLHPFTDIGETPNARLGYYSFICRPAIQ